MKTIITLLSLVCFSGISAQLNFEANKLMSTYQYLDQSISFDFDQDGYIDILSTYNKGINSNSNNYNDGGIVWYRNNGAGGFETHIIHL